MKNKIFIVYGKSSTGKDTVVNKVLNMDTRIKRLIPITTRPMRHGEKNNKDYIFTSEDLFIKMINNNELMEHRKYKVVDSENNLQIWRYGHKIPDSNISLMIGTIDIVNNMLSIDNPEYEIYPIYITVVEEERLYRMIVRENKNENPNYREVARRFISDIHEYNSYKNIDELMEKSKIYKNYNSRNTAKEIYKYIKSIIEN